MIEPKDIPSEYVSIRQVWLKQIDRCVEAISHRFMQDTKDQYSDRIGVETVVESVLALETILIDFGEATVKTDIKKWEKENYHKIQKDEKGQRLMSRFSYYRSFFEYIVKTLNKYGLLFDSQPQGYSNVEMKSV